MVNYRHVGGRAEIGFRFVALSDDQRAMLRLLAQREEGYEDIAALKGLSVDEVRAEVKAALAELAAEREASDAARPTPVRSPPPAAPEPPKEEPAPEEPPPPETAEPPPSPPPGKPSAAQPKARPSRPSVPPERRRLLALAGGAVGVVAVVLIAIAIFSDNGSDSSSGSTTTASTEAAAAANGKVTQAVLESADDSDATGLALFGRLGKEVVLQVTADNLEPTAEGESYIVWLYRTPKLTLRVGSVGVSDSGRLGARFPIPDELLAYVASGAFDQIYVSRAPDAAYEREITRAKQQKDLPRYTGETVLTGKITGPVVKASAGKGG